eukprot:GHVU01151720.1.p1 GENE.GHVU01151720.1~~GHVU01151720.1.p1  ORF type:complete len:429 (-),score=32.71 GHVU01151720.1:719-1984(-)
MSVTPEEAEPVPQKPKMSRKSSYWVRLNKKWKRRGVVEIDVDHHRYDVLECIRQGITSLLEDHPELGPKDNLEQEDYDHVTQKTLETSDGKTFEFASYASSVFSTMRRAVGLSEAAYKLSLAPEELPYLEFMSNSNSGLDFFMTNDRQYFLKTDKLYCINLLRRILGRYLAHFLQFPHSLIVKYLGLYSVNIPGQGNLYFYVMQSIFYPDDRIEKRFDVKGCMAGRYQKPREDGAVNVLKDQNFKDEQINLGAQRDWFLRQVEHDLALMAEFQVQDYSLLVGSHPLHASETQPASMFDMVVRVQKSVPKSPEKTENGRGLQADGRPHLTKRPFSFIDPDASDDVTAQNRRLLPTSRNALHVIDGPDTRYYLGFIDFLTLYECRQKVVRLYKNVKFCCGDHSTVPPLEYSQRLERFIQEHTT